MIEIPVAKAVEGLKVAAREFKKAVNTANQLPENFPKEFVMTLFEHIDEIEGVDEDSLRIARQLRDKILETLEMYDDDYDFLKRPHNQFYVKVSSFLSVSNIAEDQRTKVSIHSEEYEEQRGEILKQSQVALDSADYATKTVNNFIQQNGLINIGNIDFGSIEIFLAKSKKAITGLSFELKSPLIDLSWVSEFMDLVATAGKNIAMAVKKLDREFRSSAMVSAIKSFLEKSRRLADLVQKLIRQVTRPSSGSLTAAAATQDPIPLEMSSLVNQKFQSIGSSAAYIPSSEVRGITATDLWMVERVFRTADGCWHAIIGRFDHRVHLETKTIGVSALLDKRHFQPIQQVK